jgi:hypothetical protein
MTEQSTITIRDVTFHPVDGVEDEYEATGRWGTARVALAWPGEDIHPATTVNGLRIPPITDQTLAACGIAAAEGENYHLPALAYVAEVLRSAPVGLFRYLPAAHDTGGLTYSLIGGILDRTGCIVVYHGEWHGEVVNRQIDIVFSAPMPHVLSFLETVAEEDKEAMRQAVEERIQHLQGVLTAMTA